jgi:hypothetical protein
LNSAGSEIPLDARRLEDVRHLVVGQHRMMVELPFPPATDRAAPDGGLPRIAYAFREVADDVDVSYWQVGRLVRIDELGSFRGGKHVRVAGRPRGAYQATPTSPRT